MYSKGRDWDAGPENLRCIFVSVSCVVKNDEVSPILRIL